jgi:hypothetical protein
MVNMRPLQLHSQPRPAATQINPGNATYRRESHDHNTLL